MFNDILLHEHDDVTPFSAKLMELTKDGREQIVRLRAEGWSPNDKERSGKQKNVTLSFMQRIVIVPESSVSQKIIDDLNGPLYDWMGNPIIK